MAKLRLLFLGLFFVAGSFAASASDAPANNPETRVIQIENRVKEIWKMDFSEMDKGQKLEIRKELKALKKEMKTTGLDDKVSISVGAIIIILLVIILIS